MVALQPDLAEWDKISCINSSINLKILDKITNLKNNVNEKNAKKINNRDYMDK